MEPILSASAERVMVRFIKEDERVSEPLLFVELLKTDDRDYIPYLKLYLPCSFAHLLALIYFPFCSLFVLLQAAYLHGIHQHGERSSFAQGLIKWVDRRFFSSPWQAWTSFEVLVNGVFMKVLGGTYRW